MRKGRGPSSTACRVDVVDCASFVAASGVSPSDFSTVARAVVSVSRQWSSDNVVTCATDVHSGTTRTHRMSRIGRTKRWPAEAYFMTTDYARRLRTLPARGVRDDERRHDAVSGIVQLRERVGVGRDLRP